MLFVATSINYMDRQVLSILKPFLEGGTLHLQPFFHGWPTVERSINLNEVQYGYIVWAFQIAYALGVIFAGRFIDKVGCRAGYPIVTGVWSISAMCHALVTSVFGFGVARFFLGLGESGNFPAAIKATAEWFPPRERSLATGIFNSGAGVGAILAPFLVPWVALHFGRRASFLITGTFSAAWIVWWSVHYRKPKTPTDAFSSTSPNHASLPWTRLLRYRQTWGFALGKFLTDPVWWFYLFWIPRYLQGPPLNLTLTSSSGPVVAIYVVSCVGSVAGGWLSSFMIKRGRSVNASRKTAMLICALCVLPVALVPQATNVWMVVALVGLAAAAHQGWSANLFTLPSDMFPKSAVGSVVGFGGMVGSIGGVLLQLLAGKVGYVVLYAIAGSAYVTALLIVHLLTPRLAPAKLS